MTEKTVATLERELAQAHRRAEQEHVKNERERARQRLKDYWDDCKSRLLYEMTRHLGKNNAIGAGALFEIVFQRPFDGNMITGTRLLRRLIVQVKYGPEAILIAHSCCNIRPGYYIPIGSEAREYRQREECKVKRKIGRLAVLFGVNDAIYAGQLALEMTQFPERS